MSLFSSNSITKGTICFTSSVTLSAAAGLIILSDVAIGSSTLATLGGIYRLYRWKRVQITLAPTATGSPSSLVSCSFVPGTAGMAPPASLATNEAEHMCYLPIEGTFLPEERFTMTLTWADMKGLTNWFMTDNDGTDVNLEGPGTLFFTSADVDAIFTVLFKVEYEFKAPTDAAIISLLTISDRIANQSQKASLSDLHIARNHQTLLKPAPDISELMAPTIKKTNVASSASTLALRSQPRAPKNTKRSAPTLRTNSNWRTIRKPHFRSA